MAKGKDRFQVGAFLDIPVTLPILQLLGRSPQLRVQLAFAIAFYQSTKRKKKSARFNPVSTAAMTSKSWAPSAIETMAHENE